MSLENGALVGESPLVEKVANKSLHAEEAGGPPPQARRLSDTRSPED